MKTRTIDELQTQLERLVREHLVAQRKAAEAAVARAFAAASAPSRAAPACKATGRRRPPDEMASLVERLFEAVRANPGKTIATIASHVGKTPRALHRPMMHLKRTGRVRSAGQRNLARYFPMSSKAA